MSVHSSSDRRGVKNPEGGQYMANFNEMVFIKTTRQQTQLNKKLFLPNLLSNRLNFSFFGSHKIFLLSRKSGMNVLVGFSLHLFGRFKKGVSSAIPGAWKIGHFFSLELAKNGQKVFFPRITGVLSKIRRPYIKFKTLIPTILKSQTFDRCHTSTFPLYFSFLKTGGILSKFMSWLAKKEDFNKNIFDFT